MQQENYHWREFALGADRHRLQQWLETKPFDGVDHDHAQANASKSGHSSKSHSSKPPSTTISSSHPHPLQNSHVANVNSSTTQSHHDTRHAHHGHAQIHHPLYNTSKLTATAQTQAQRIPTIIEPQQK